MEENKKWERPVLTVLVRNKPEERVLLGCKMVSGEMGALTTNTACGNDICFPCVQETAS